MFADYKVIVFDLVGMAYPLVSSTAAMEQTYLATALSVPGQDAISALGTSGPSRPGLLG